jgi:hypothetical protein
VPSLCRLCRYRLLPFSRLAEDMYVAALDCLCAHNAAQDMSTRGLTTVLWCCHVHRMQRSRRRGTAVPAAPGCQAWRATSQDQKYATAATCRINEACPGCSRGCTCRPSCSSSCCCCTCFSLVSRKLLCHSPRMLRPPFCRACWSGVEPFCSGLCRCGYETSARNVS